MDRVYSIAAISGILCAILAASAYADSSCSNVTRDFYTYDKGLPTTANNVFPYPWQDMSWLLATLGPPSASPTKHFVQTVAVWKKYDYSITEVGGIQVKSEGSLPPRVIANSNIAQVSNYIGPPDITQTGNMSEYDWTCTDTNSNLTITSNDSNQSIVSYKGTYCPTALDKQNCQNFANYKIAFPQYQNIGVGLQNAALYVQHPPLHPQYTPEQAPEVASKQTLQFFSTQLHTQITNMGQLQAIATQALINYYEKLSQCIPGTYQYPYPFSLGGQLISTNDVAPYFYLATSVIQGMKDKKCAVTTTEKIGKNNGSTTCQYPAEMLAEFTAQKAVNDSTNNSNFNATQVEQTKILLKNCQMFLNGTLVPITPPPPSATART